MECYYAAGSAVFSIPSALCAHRGNNDGNNDYRDKRLTSVPGTSGKDHQADPDNVPTLRARLVTPVTVSARARYTGA